MSYDEASFRAGFALGRALWRPPASVGDVDTGLGWKANPNYLARDAGEYLGTQEERNWYKYADGYAVCCFLITPGPPYFRLASSIMLASTTPEYATKTGYSTVGPDIEFDEYGLHWYAGWRLGMYDRIVGSSPFPVVDTQGYALTSAEEVVRYVLQAAGVRSYRVVNR